MLPVERAEPGAILSQRPVPNSFNDSRGSYQLLIRSKNSHNQPVAVTSIVLVPENAQPDKLLSNQQPYDAVNVSCEPSYTIPQSNSFLDTDTVINSALKNGWFVSIPDYEGSDTAFTNGIQSGQAVLDSIRAALSSKSITGLSPDATTLMQGYSGGAIASGWAAELQGTYAPELNISGVALGGTVPNITNIYERVSRTPRIALAPLTLLGMTAQDPDMRKVIDDHLVQTGPVNASLFYSVTQSCLTATGGNLPASIDYKDFFQDRGAFLASEEWESFAKRVSYLGYRQTPSMPIYSYHGTADDVTPIEDTDALLQKYCKDGASVTSVRDVGVNHLDELYAGAQPAFDWLAQRMEGLAVREGCFPTTIG